MKRPARFLLWWGVESRIAPHHWGHDEEEEEEVEEEGDPGAAHAEGQVGSRKRRVEV